MVEHAPEWPDKIMAAAAFATLGGLLSLSHAALIVSGATFDPSSTWPGFYIPTAWIVGFGLLSTVIGIFGYIHQSSLLVGLGITTNILSLGLLGASSLVGLLAIWPLIRSFKEGEETKLDRHRMRAHEWPDKAVMASVTLATGGVMTLLQGAFVLTDQMAAPWLASQPVVVGALSLTVGVGAIFAARDVFHLRRAWTGWVAAVACMASAAFWIVGPIIALITLGFLALANKEAEFLLTPA